MARYIDADKLTDKLEELQFNAPVMTPVMKIYNVIELVEDQPTADVAEVVRCKDCKHYEHGRCSQISYIMDGYYQGGFEVKTPNDFCSYGERSDIQ